MNKKLLELYKKCTEHNVKLTIKFVPEGNTVLIRGIREIYKKITTMRMRQDPWVEYKKLVSERVISINDLKYCITDLLEYYVDNVIHELDFKEEQERRPRYIYDDNNLQQTNKP